MSLGNCDNCKHYNSIQKIPVDGGIRKGEVDKVRICDIRKDGGEYCSYEPLDALKPQPITIDPFKTTPNVTTVSCEIVKQINEEEDAFVINTIYPWVEAVTGKISKDDLRDAIRQWKRPGKWKFNKDRHGYWLSTCSECKHKIHGDENSLYKSKYCPNCGRRMENWGTKGAE